MKTSLPGLCAWAWSLCREAVCWLLAQPIVLAAGPGPEADHRIHKHIRALALLGSRAPKLSRRRHLGWGGGGSLSLTQIFHRNQRADHVIAFVKGL